MARYVLVEFDDDAEAEAFVNKILQRSIDLAARKKQSKYRIKGFFAKPTNFCKCGPLTDRQQANEVTRGAKYGWMVHRKCRKPRPMFTHSPRNLLDPMDMPIQMRDAFLNLTAGYDKRMPTGEPLHNYPISVRESR